MACGFMSFSTVFKPNRNDGRLVMIGCVQYKTLFIVEKISATRGMRKRDH